MFNAAPGAKELTAQAACLLKNILMGLRLSLFLPVRPQRFHATLVQAVLLFAASLLLNLFYDYLTTRPGNYFNIHGLYYQATLYLLFFLSVVFIAATARAFTAILPLIVMVLSVTPTTFLTYLVIYQLVLARGLFSYDYVYWLLAGLYLCWHLAIVLRVVLMLFGGVLWKILSIMSIYTVFNLVPWLTLPNQPLWFASFNPDSDTTDRARARIDLEALFYAQPGLLEQNLGPLLPQRPGITDLYFLGVAGYSNEDVFMNEARLAKALLDERFGTYGRSVLLVNNRQTFATSPLANNHNLAAALERISQSMDTEEDILFLLLTSHGEKEDGLSVRIENHSFNKISPAGLAEALNRSGIKWRIIVISACYSGEFIEALANPHTLVITASRGDRNSFGCGHDGDFTYFGQAFFGGALRDRYSFMEAFEEAKSTIEAREGSEGLTPSLPQMAAGEEIGIILSGLAEQWQRKNKFSSTETE